MHDFRDRRGAAAASSALSSSRPMTRTTYTPQLAAEVCALVEAGHNLQAISERPAMPDRVTLHRWLNRHGDFRRMYDAACARRAFVLIRPKTGPEAPRRPSPIYTPELARQICLHILEGESLNKVSRRQGMPHLSNISMWLDRHEDFRRRYAIACEMRDDILGDEILALAENCLLEPYNVAPRDQIAWTRLRIGVRVQRLAQLTPKKDWLGLGGGRFR